MALPSAVEQARRGNGFSARPEVATGGGSASPIDLSSRLTNRVAEAREAAFPARASTGACSNRAGSARKGN